MRTSLAIRSAGLLVAVMLPFAATPSAAQQTDPRWLSWLGCWERADNETFPERRLTCILPADSGTGVEIVALIGGRVLNSERIEASGSERVLDEDGCTGTERASWSAEGARLYRGISVECQGGMRQDISQLFAMMSDGSWLDIQGVALPEGTGLRRLRYRATRSLEGVPDVIRSRLAGMDDIERAQSTAALAPVTGASVVEASQHLQAPVVQVWLAERHQGFTLNARELRALSSAGVAAEVIDIMVALSYPRAFRLEPNLQVTERIAGEQTRGWNTGSRTPRQPLEIYAQQPYYCNPVVDSYDLYLAYGSTYCVYDSRYLNQYGYAGWGGYYWGYRPIILTAGGVPVSGIGNPPPPVPHGRVSASGYQQDPSVASTGRQAQPREPSNQGGTSNTNTASTSTEQPASPSTGSTGSSTPATPTPQRTAQPRQP